MGGNGELMTSIQNARLVAVERLTIVGNLLRQSRIVVMPIQRCF